jgi:sensor c-di-GMP phosphodiesterase-like protein
VDHLCQTAQSPGQQKKAHPPENAEKTKTDESVKEKVKEADEKMEVELQEDEIKMDQDVAESDKTAEPPVCIIVAQQNVCLPAQFKKTYFLLCCVV